MNLELLSPAGSFAALEAAVSGGADAVYIGGEAFNARINATNFTDDEIKKALAFCHKHGVRLHVAVNILIADRDMKKAIEYVSRLYEYGVDALIVADLGLAVEIHRLFPDFEMHASTQLSGHNSTAAKICREIGFSRMVCAREMSGKDIKKLKENSDIDIEMFVHGAICVCHSGQCLMSAMIGGRSGNAGLCAQPCRMQYNGNGYPLSMKDMCLACHITEIKKLGVCSLKVEGRMKSPEYVYGVTKIYRTLIDENRNATQKEIKQLEALFSRSGFTDGYFTGKISGNMNGIRTEHDKKLSLHQVRLDKVKRNISPIPDYNRTLPDDLSISEYPKEKAKTSLSARFYKPETIPDSHPFDIVYLPLEKYDPEKANGILMPPVIYDSDSERVKKALKSAIDKGAEHIMITNIGQFDLVNDLGAILHADFRLNCFNAHSADFLIGLGVCDVILSCELSLPRIRDIILQKSVIVYGRLPLMLLEKRLNIPFLRDRKNAVFPIVREGGRDIILNSAPTYMLDRQKELKGAFINNRHFIFTTETAAEVKDVLSDFKNQKKRTENIRRIKA